MVFSLNCFLSSLLKHVRINASPIIFLFAMTIVSSCSCDPESESNNTKTQKNIPAQNSTQQSTEKQEATHSDTCSALFNAIEQQDLPAVQQLIRRGVDVNCKDADNVSPLEKAMGYFYDLKIASALIKAGANVNSKTNSDKTFLESAGFYGRDKIVELLLQNGADPYLGMSVSKGDRALFSAIKDGDLPAVQSLIKDGVSLDQKNILEETALGRAAAYGHIDIVSALLVAGRKINGDQYKPTVKALANAITRGNDKVVCLLLKNEADPDATIYTLDPVRFRPRRQSLLQLACKKENPLVVKALLDGGVNINKRTHGHPPLIIATLSGNIQTLGLLLDAGADMNAMKRGQGHTPLMIASREGKKEVVEFLLNKKARVNQRSRDRESETALTLAARQGHPAIVELLIANGADINHKNRDGATSLMHAVHGGDMTIVSILLNAGADVNIKDDDDETALCVALKNDRKKMVDLLLQNGADPLVFTNGDKKLNNAAVQNIFTQKKYVNYKDGNGWTPLHNAVMATRDIDIISALLASGADVDAKNKFGSTALHHAACSGNCAVILKTLLTSGASINIKNNDGNTPLHETCTAEGVETLLASGADVNAKNNKGETPLHLANAVCASALLKSGADINAKENWGNTPLHFAAFLGRLEVVEVLLASGANISVVNNNNYTPMGLAEKEGEEEIASLLHKELLKSLGL